MKYPGLNIPKEVDRLSAKEFREILQHQPAVRHGYPPPGSPVGKKPPTSRGGRNEEEHIEQCALVRWLRERNIRYNATPNGGHRAITTAKRLRAEGVSPGFPDITIWPPLRSGLPVVYIEMKRQQGGSVSTDQAEWLQYLSDLSLDGFNIKEHIAEGCAEAIKILEGYGYPGSDRVNTGKNIPQKEELLWTD